MIASSFDESNLVMDTPKGLTSDDVMPLSSFIGKSIDWDSPIVISCWKVTDEELEQIIKTRRVWITIMGAGMPPIYPSGISPFNELKITDL